VYYYGNKAKVIVDFSFPDKIHNMSIENNVLVFKVGSQNGVKEYTYRFNINVTGTFNDTHFSKGYKSFEFNTINRGEVVSIRSI